MNSPTSHSPNHTNMFRYMVYTLMLSVVLCCNNFNPFDQLQLQMNQLLEEAKNLTFPQVQERLLEVEKNVTAQGQKIESEILQLFGLDQKPKPNREGKRKTTIDYLKNAYHLLYDVKANKTFYFMELFDYNEGQIDRINEKQQTIYNIVQADLIVTLNNRIKQKSKKMPYLKQNRDNRFYFDTNRLPTSDNLQVTHAYLRVYRWRARSRIHFYHSLTYTLFELITVAPDVIQLEPVDKVNVSGSNRGGWIQFNVTSSLARWKKDPKKNLGLFIKIHSDPDNELYYQNVALVVGNYLGKNEIFKRRQPFLTVLLKYSNNGTSEQNSTILSQITKMMQTNGSLIELEDKSKTLPDKKNDTFLNGSLSSEQMACSKHEFYFNFKTFNWTDWILYPKAVMVAYCGGQCNLTKPQTTMKKIDYQKEPMKCCKQKELSPHALVIHDGKGNVVLEKFQNIIVQKCSCQ